MQLRLQVGGYEAVQHEAQVLEDVRRSVTGQVASDGKAISTRLSGEAGKA